MATAPSINQPKLTARIKKLPKPKQRKWTQIGAKAIAGDEGALARLTKKGLIGGKGKKSPSAPGSPKAPKAPSAEGTLTGYKPPSITDTALEAASPKPGATPGTRKDAITGLNVAVNYGPNPYHPAGATAAGAAAGKAAADPGIKAQPTQRKRKIKQLGKLLQDARDSGDKKKAKRLHKHIKRLRKLSPGTSLPKNTVAELAKEKRNAKEKGRTKQVETLSAQIQRLRERAGASASARNKKGGEASSRLGKKKAKR